MVTEPTGPKTKNDCAGKVQQQITKPDQTSSIYDYISQVVSSLEVLNQNFVMYISQYPIYEKPPFRTILYICEETDSKVKETIFLCQ
jgi:hypothetical protein